MFTFKNYSVLLMLEKNLLQIIFLSIYKFSLLIRILFYFIVMLTKYHRSISQFRFWLISNLDSILKNRGITLPTKDHLVKALVFLVVMYECESWTVKKSECRRIDAFELLEKTLESPLDCKEIQPVHPKGDQPWVFTGRTNIEAENPILWTPNAKS